MNQLNQNRRLTTVKNLPKSYPYADFNEGGIRWLIFNANDNGFSKCIVRAGRKVLIDLDLFEKWLDEKAMEGCE